MTAWIWPTNPENYAVLEKQDYKFMDFLRRPGGVARGHKVAVYVIGRVGIGAILETSSPVYERRAPVPVWADEIQAGKTIYRYRADTRLVAKGWVDFRPIWPKLRSPSERVRALGNQGYGIFLRGVALRQISDADMSIIEAALSGTRAASSPTPPPPLAKAAIPPKKRFFGAPLNFRELRHEPINEQGVVYVFAMTARELGFLVEGIGTGYPDCTAKRRTSSGLYESVNIEFEYKASNFQQHRHDPKGCDIIVCWENDWPDCPVEVIALKEQTKNLPA